MANPAPLTTRKASKMRHEMLRLIGLGVTQMAVFVGGFHLLAIHILQPFIAEKLAFKGVIYTDGFPASTLLPIFLLTFVCVVITAMAASMVVSAIDDRL